MGQTIRPDTTTPRDDEKTGTFPGDLRGHDSFKTLVNRRQRKTMSNKPILEIFSDYV